MFAGVWDYRLACFVVLSFLAAIVDVLSRERGAPGTVEKLQPLVSIGAFLSASFLQPFLASGEGIFEGNPLAFTEPLEVGATAAAVLLQLATARGWLQGAPYVICRPQFTATPHATCIIVRTNDNSLAATLIQVSQLEVG